MAYLIADLIADLIMAWLIRAHPFADLIIPHLLIADLIIAYLIAAPIITHLIADVIEPR